MVIPLPSRTHRGRLLVASWTPEGQIRVGETPGVYAVTARIGDTEAQAQIRVLASKKRDSDGGGNGGGGGDDEKKAKVISWKGSIPPQKWTNFYTKVVSPFASASGLRLRVEVEMPADENDQQAKAQLDKIRTALKDLKLDESVELS